MTELFPLVELRRRADRRLAARWELALAAGAGLKS